MADGNKKSVEVDSKHLGHEIDGKDEKKRMGKREWRKWRKEKIQREADRTEEEKKEKKKISEGG